MKTSVAIQVKNLDKAFVFNVKDEKRGFFSNLFSPTKKKVEAVKEISFDMV